MKVKKKKKERKRKIVAKCTYGLQRFNYRVKETKEKEKMNISLGHNTSCFYPTEHKIFIQLPQ